MTVVRTAIKVPGHIGVTTLMLPRESDLLRRCPESGLKLVAEGSENVRAPAIGLSVSSQRARVIATGSNGLEGDSTLKNGTNRARTTHAATAQLR